ncbi:MAG: hypothetical protein WAN35_07330 [Terracidiphilus sp.]
MLETLAGRLKWERIDDGMRVELPAPLDWPNVRRTVGSWMLTWLFYYLLISFMRGIRHGIDDARKDWAIFLAFLPLYMAGGFYKILARRTILTLTPADMTLHKGFFQIKRFKRVFANSRLHNLCFCASRKEQTAEREEVKNCLLIDVEDKTISILSGITEEEANVLIARMMEIYRFPNERDETKQE